MSKLTQNEWRAIDDALAHLLAGTWAEDDDLNDLSHADVVSAQRKVWERIK